METLIMQGVSVLEDTQDVIKYSSKGIKKKLRVHVWHVQGLQDSGFRGKGGFFPEFFKE